MNRQVVYAIALVFAAVLGAAVLGFVVLGNNPAAQAQKPDTAQQWEYKIYRVETELFHNKAEAEFNKLAKEGWEFAQTIPVSPNQSYVYVLFRRLKK